LSCFADMEGIHIGREIKSVFDKRGLTITEFSKRINKSRENVYSIFNRETIDTGLLLNICEALEFDFFSLYVSRINPIKDSEIDRLRKENELLNEINSLLKSKSKK
jgi:transcriptional regulator with XRE-family HTH domain